MTRLTTLVLFFKMQAPSINSSMIASLFLGKIWSDKLSFPGFCPHPPFIHFAVVYIFFPLTRLPVPRDIMIPSSFILTITHSIVPIDIQHEIQHTKQRTLYFRAFWGYFNGFDSCSKRQQKTA